MAMTYAGFVCRVLLALIFLVAAVGKARIPNAFARTINSIGVHTPLAPVVAWGVIAYEATRIKLRNEQGRFFGIIRV